MGRHQRSTGSIRSAVASCLFIIALLPSAWAAQESSMETPTYRSFTIATTSEAAVVLNAVRIATDRLRLRTGLVPAPGGLDIELTVRDGLGREHFEIETGPPGRLRVVGGDERGVFYGVGQLLRSCVFAPGSLTPQVRPGPSGPGKPLRGMYLASHFGNFWEIGRPERVREEIEELALWGANSLTVIYPVDQFTAVDGEASQRYIARLNALGTIATACGMDFGLIISLNQNVRNQAVPPGAAFTPIPGVWHHGVELCPSNPEGRRLMMQWQRHMLGLFEHLDFAIAWPYDDGGCGCAGCQPWGGNGFLRAARDFAGLVHERFPRAKFWLSTWWFDLHRDQGDFRGLYAAMPGDGPLWFDGLLGGQHQLQALAKRPAAARCPVAVFPEISMCRMDPWGGFGANPLPGELAGQLAHQADTVGGWPYSEGLYEDLNKSLWLQHCWNPAIPVDDALAAYAAYHLGADPAGFTELARQLEKTHTRDGWNIASLAGADQAWARAQTLERAMPGWAKDGWRWRVLRIRTRLDALVQEKGYLRAMAELRPLLDELATIYEVSPASRWVVHLPVPKAGNLAFGRPVTASSVLPGHLVAVGNLVNGIDQSGSETFDLWENDPKPGVEDWITIDLGSVQPITTVKLQFSRNAKYGTTFSGVPQSVALAVSADGTSFSPAGASSEVPVEGAPYKARYWEYACKQPGRFVRISFGAAQGTGPAAGRLRLAEIEVY